MVFIVCVLSLGLVSGCATTEVRTVSQPGPTQPQGVYHKVCKGETLWRIAKAYGLTIDQIIQSNNIPNIAQLEQNQLILIPGAAIVKEITDDGEDVKKEEFVWPLKGKVISHFGDRKDERYSRGICIEASVGDTAHASRSGKVVFADAMPGYGNTIILDHQDGYFSFYSHNAALNVKLGDFVMKGEPLAVIGSQGDQAFLHFEIRKHNVGDNPLFYLP